MKSCSSLSVRSTLARLAVLPLFAALALGSASPKKGSDDTSSTTTTTAAKIGVPVLVGDAEYTVLDIVNRGTKMKPNESFEKEAVTSGNFIQVHLKVVNKGKKEGFMANAPKIVDTTGREFGTIENAFSFRPKGTDGVMLDKVQPSMSKEYTEIYEIPVGVTTASMKASDFDLFGSSKSIDLGTLPPAPPAPVAAAPAASPAPAGKPVKVAAANAVGAKAKAAPAKK